MVSLGKSERQVLRDSPLQSAQVNAVDAGAGLPGEANSHSPENTRKGFDSHTLPPRIIPLQLICCSASAVGQGFLAEGYSVIGFDNGDLRALPPITVPSDQLAALQQQADQTNARRVRRMLRKRQ